MSILRSSDQVARVLSEAEGWHVRSVLYKLEMVPLRQGLILKIVSTQVEGGIAGKPGKRLLTKSQTCKYLKKWVLSKLNTRNNCSKDANDPSM